MNDGYSFDVAYVGNDIKGETRSSRFLLPAQDFNFGLFGNWQNPQLSLRRRLMFWKPHEKIPTYRQVFFSQSKGKIPQDDVPVLYSSTKINLNCTHQDCVDWDVITLRTFEVLACRGFLITDKVPVAEKTMQGCMVFTEGDKDLKDKIRYYLENETERLKIAQKGYEYTTRFATLEMRMKELVSYLESLS
jgi:spore maturation protein CgeB